MGVVKDIQIRSNDSRKKRICDLVLDDHGRIYIVDMEEERSGKKKYTVCINHALVELLEERNKQLNLCLLQVGIISYFPYLGLSFPICKMGFVIIIPVLWGFDED